MNAVSGAQGPGSSTQNNRLPGRDNNLSCLWTEVGGIDENGVWHS